MNHFINCHMCNRGGRGNDKDKCACGWQVVEPSNMGCYLGTPIVGQPQEPKIRKLTRSEKRYQAYLEYGDGFDKFIDFCKWYDYKKKQGVEL